MRFILGVSLLTQIFAFHLNGAQGAESAQGQSPGLTEMQNQLSDAYLKYLKAVQEDAKKSAQKNALQKTETEKAEQSLGEAHRKMSGYLGEQRKEGDSEALKDHAQAQSLKFQEKITETPEQAAAAAKPSDSPLEIDPKTIAPEISFPAASPSPSLKTAPAR